MTTTPSDDVRCEPSVARMPEPRKALVWPTILLVVIAMGICAAVVFASQRPQDTSRVTPNDVPVDVGIEQKLNAQVPLDIKLRDETGAEVRLRDLLDGKPIILTPVYFQCPMLCGMTMDGQVRSLTELSLDAGQDFTALTVSFDPRETSELAAGAKRTALTRYGRRDAERGWRFLTGDEAEIRRLMDAVGFRYKFDPVTGQYAHAAGLIVLTPDGVVSRYLHGIHFPARDLRLALVEASEGKIGTAADQVLLLCYHYDPTTGKYGLAIMNALRLGGLFTVLGMTTAIVVMVRRDRRLAHATSLNSRR